MSHISLYSDIFEKRGETIVKRNQNDKKKEKKEGEEDAIPIEVFFEFSIDDKYTPEVRFSFLL
mgnify:CR=1 FL=1